MKDFDELLASLGETERAHDEAKQKRQDMRPPCWDPRATVASERSPTHPSRESELRRLGYHEDQMNRPTPQPGDWYYRKANELQGPVQEHQLTELIQRGQIGAHDYVWHINLNGWSTVAHSHLVAYLPFEPTHQADDTLAHVEIVREGSDEIVQPEVVTDPQRQSPSQPLGTRSCWRCGQALRLGKAFCTECGAHQR